MSKKAATKATKHAGGRPPKYTSAQQLMDAGREYFDTCEKARELPEKAGLCIGLGITRETYNEYRKKPQFSDAIKGMDLYIESCWTRRLGGQAATGAIFYLKNAFHEHFHDRKELELSGSVKHGEMERLSNDELESIATGGAA